MAMAPVGKEACIRRRSILKMPRNVKKEGQRYLENQDQLTKKYANCAGGSRVLIIGIK